MSEIVIGVDGGGSRTRVMVGTADGEELATLEGPGSAISLQGVEHSAAVIADLVTRALAEIAQPGAVFPRILYCGVSGTGREEAAKALHSAVDRKELAEEVIIDSDGLIAYYDAFEDRPGILLVAGTGSIAYGRSPSGTLVRCGGWGPSFGDEGGGGWIGRRALSIVAASSDGREPATALLFPILAATQCEDVQDLIQWAAAADARAFASLVPAVLSTAGAGDPRASALVTLAAEELVLHIRALARQLFSDERAAVSVALSGGLMHRGSLLRKRLEQRLKSAVPGAQVRAEDVLPARGALRAAARRIHLPTSP
ncbi:MAG TPA: BadF/BadG/BcrA/BcrD ATPase family protein [Gemmatimonadaceae bacterium]|nr:BadF/BadG/BcrA/BcrD ATPase family protein [Gemmatimonadaceae bacterium]